MGNRGWRMGCHRGERKVYGMTNKIFTSSGRGLFISGIWHDGRSRDVIRYGLWRCWSSLRTTDFRRRIIASGADGSCELLRYEAAALPFGTQLACVDLGLVFETCRGFSKAGDRPFDYIVWDDANHCFFLRHIDILAAIRHKVSGVMRVVGTWR